MKNSFDRIIDILFYGSWALIIIIALMLYFCFPVSAAGTNSGKLPIRTGETNQYFSLTEDSLGIDPQTVFNTAHTFLCNTYSIDPDQDYFIVLTDSNYNSYLTGRWRFYLTFVFDPSYPASVNDSSNYLQQNMVFEGDIYSIAYDWQYNVPSTLATIYYGPVNNTSLTLYGSESRQIDYTTNVNNVGSKSISYVPRFVVLYSGDGIYSGNDKLVLTNSAGGIINPSGNIGQVIDPSLFNNYPTVSNSTLPSVPTINNYTWNTYSSPAIDTTNLESLVESLIDVVNYGFTYLKDNISGSFNNLISNISNLFSYIGDLINYGFKSIQESLNSGFQNLVDNFRSLFQPLVYYVNYIIQPVDQEIIYDAFNNTSLMTNYSSVVSFYSDVHDVFVNTSEPDNFIIPIHLEDLSYFHLDTYYLDLGFHFKKFRTPFRAFCWVFCSFGAVFLVEHNLSSWLLGSSGGGGKIDN